MTDIRKLEIALIDAAIKAKWTKTAGADDALLRATEALIFGCEECNAGGHTCPGDGNSIPHGAGSCGDHDEPRKRTGYCIECIEGDEDPHAWCDCRSDDGPCKPPCRQRAHMPQNCPSRTEWVSSTFLHIEKGDELRIGQDEATVKDAKKLNWHVDNSDRYHPKPWEHVELRADVGFGMAPFPTDTPVEILCDEERKAQLIMSEAGLKPRRSDDA